MPSGHTGEVSVKTSSAGVLYWMSEPAWSQERAQERPLLVHMPDKERVDKERNTNWKWMNANGG